MNFWILFTVFVNMNIQVNGILLDEKEEPTQLHTLNHHHHHQLQQRQHHKMQLKLIKEMK